MTDEFDWFKNNGIFMPMINDTGRNQFYKAAIESSVAGKTVCDIGTGTGFMSVLAARAGAKKVYAVEQDAGRAEFARDVMSKIGLADIVEVINSDFLHTDISADIYVSETIGSAIFNENIVEIAGHATRHGGTFIPGQFEIVARVYKNHPIFPLVQSRSDAYEFQPDIEIDPVFEQIVNAGFQHHHTLDNTLYSANRIHNLFAQLHKFDDLRLTTLYETEPLVVDLNSVVDMNSLYLTVPLNQFSMPDEGVCVVVFWQARHGEHVLDVTKTIWGNPNKIVLPWNIKQKEIVLWYNHNTRDWKFSY